VESIDEITEKLMEKLQDRVNQKVQDDSRNFKIPQIKRLEKTQKQLNELRKDFDKLQSKTKETIKKKIYEIRQHNV
jgi:hypothetical protein